MNGWSFILITLSNPAPNNLQIEKYRHDLEVIRSTAEQIIKDFNLFGIEINFSGNEMTAYNELKSQLAPALSALYKNNASAFVSLLYRIDVSENKFKEVLINFSSDQLDEKLADLVIEREFMKVLFKKLYK